MEAAALQRRLARLLEQHQVLLETDEDWLLTDGDFPAIRASWHDGSAGASGRLDIDVVLDEGVEIEESFAGEGTGEAACRDALDRFAAVALPVLLAACWYETDERRLTLASFESGITTWDFFAGPVAVHGAEVPAPDDAFAPIIDALRREMPPARVHWLRLFARRATDGILTIEALLDNQPWAAGERAWRELAWPSADAPYDAHAFVMLDVRDY